MNDKTNELAHRQKYARVVDLKFLVVCPHCQQSHEREARHFYFGAEYISTTCALCKCAYRIHGIDAKFGGIPR